MPTWLVTRPALLARAVDRMPVLCKGKGKAVDPRTGLVGGREGEKDEGDPESDPGTLRFAIFALRDLKACEEVVLGWEWDDGSVVHNLPALIEAGTGAGPSKMTCVSIFTYLPLNSPAVLLPSHYCFLYPELTCIHSCHFQATPY